MKKAKRFDVGGDVRERARKFAELADRPEEQEAYQKAQHARGQAEAEASDRARSASKAATAPKPAPTSVSDAPRSKYVGSTNDAGDEGAPRSKYVGSTNDAGDEGAPRSKYVGSTNDAGDEGAPRTRSSSSTNDAAEAQNVRDVISAANRRSRESRAAISAENAERGGMSPQAERAVEAAGVAASVVPVVRGARAATEVGKRVAQGAEQAARVRQGLGRQFAEGAGDAARNTAVRTTPRDVASSAREIARESIANRRAQAEARRLREAAERKARDDAKITERAMREESRQFGANLPPSVGERVSSAASNISDRARRLYNKAKGDPTLVRGRRADGSRRGFSESADDAAQAGFKKGGKVSASSRGDGIAQRGKTRGKLL